MSGVQTTIALQDKLTGPLMKMMKAMESTIKVMETMDSATQNLDQKSLANARKNISNASADMHRLMSATSSAGNSAEKAANQQSKFNNAISGGLPSLGKLTTGLLSAVGAYKAFNAAKSFLGDMFSQGINFHAFKQSSEAAFTIFLGDAQKAKQYMDDMYAFALTTPFAYPDLLESSRNLIAFGIEAENTFSIMQSIGDAVAGISKPGEQTMDMQLLSDVFGVIQSQGRITGMELQRLGAKGIDAAQMIGDMMGVSANEMRDRITKGAVGAGQAIAGLVEGMDKQFGGLMAGVKKTWVGSIDSMKSSIRNAGTAMTEALMKPEGPLVTLVQNITGLIKKIPEHIGPAVAAFLPVINMLNEAFEAGRFDGFFSTLGTALTGIAWLLSIVAQGFIWIAEIVDTSWPIILTFFALLAATYIPSVIAGLWGMVSALISVAWGWLVAIGPVGWIILAVAALIAIIMSFGVTTEQILGFVGGLFFALGAAIWNIIAHIWNTFAMFAEFLINLFIDPTYAVKKLFYDMVKMTIDQMAALAGSFDKAADILGNAFVSGANMAITAINWVIKALNKIPGIDIGTMGKVSARTGNNLSQGLKNFSNSLQAPTSSKNVKSIGRMDYKSLPGSYQSGYSKGSSLAFTKTKEPVDKNDDPFNMKKLMDGMLNGAGGPKTKNPKNPTGGKLDSIGKIDDEINIADEDLKLLLEMADRKSIQNFRTLNPTIQFTGDMTIREEADIDKIVTKIASKLKEDADASTEGVYA